MRITEAKITPAGHHPEAFEVIRQALIQAYVPEEDPGKNASHIFAFIHDTGLKLRLPPIEERLIYAIEAALSNLGVPTSDYPAPVANAVEILRDSLLIKRTYEETS
jgi:hypothetical protein